LDLHGRNQAQSSAITRNRAQSSAITIPFEGLTIHTLWSDPCARSAAAKAAKKELRNRW
jgi:hypothetical protein